HRRWPRMNLAELESHPARDHVLLAAGVDEQEILLAIVEETEIAFRIGLLRRQRRALWRAGVDERQQLRRRIAGAARAVLFNEVVDARERLRRDARAVAQARDEFAVVHRAAAERRLGHPGAPADIRDAAKQCPAASLHRILRNRTAGKSCAQHWWDINHSPCGAQRGILPIP